MRIVLTGGGTGGHIFPLVAVARKIKEIAKERGIETVEFLYIGPAFNQESEEIFRHENIAFKYIFTGKIRRYASFMNVLDLLKVPLGVIQTFWILFKFMPEAVFSKGGYGSFPVMFVSWVYGVSVRLIHESDSVPGLANKITSHFATKIAVAFESAAFKFPLKKTALLGVPTRDDLYFSDIKKAKLFFNIKSERQVLLVMGGSQGANNINNAILGVLPDLLSKYELIHIAGPAHYESMKINSDPLLTDQNREYYHLFSFLTEEMKFAYTLAGLIISRAGASSIFEIAKYEKASIIIPIKNSAQDHQRKNAYNFAKSGGAIIIEEDNLTPHILLERIFMVLDDEETRRKMETNAATFATKDSAKLIAKEILSSLGV